jgi:flagellar biosynthesis component FlhA
VCHLIDPVTETMLVAADPLPEADRVRFLTAVQAGIQSQPPSFGSSVVLTSASAREKVLAAIHEELPGVAVLAFDELPAQVMVDWQWLPVTS